MKAQFKAWHIIQWTISILGVCIAGAAFANGVPLLKALLILIASIALSLTFGAIAAKAAGAALVLVWGVVFLMLVVMAATAWSIFKPCDIPVISRALGAYEDCRNQVGWIAFQIEATDVSTDPDGLAKNHWKPVLIVLKEPASLNCKSSDTHEFAFVLSTLGGVLVGKCGIASYHRTLPATLEPGTYVVTSWEKVPPGGPNVKWSAADVQHGDDNRTASLSTQGGAIEIARKEG